MQRSSLDVVHNFANCSSCGIRSASELKDFPLIEFVPDSCTAVDVLCVAGGATAPFPGVACDDVCPELLEGTITMVVQDCEELLTCAGSQLAWSLRPGVTPFIALIAAIGTGGMDGIACGEMLLGREEYLLKNADANVLTGADSLTWVTRFL